MAADSGQLQVFRRKDFGVSSPMLIELATRVVALAGKFDDQGRSDYRRHNGRRPCPRPACRQPRTAIERVVSVFCLRAGLIPAFPNR